MKRILSLTAAILAATLLQAAPVQPGEEITDTLRNAVVTGTRVAMPRFS